MPLSLLMRSKDALAGIQSCLEEHLDNVSPQDWDSVVLPTLGGDPGHLGLQQATLRRGSLRCGRHQARTGAVSQSGLSYFLSIFVSALVNPQPKLP